LTELAVTVDGIKAPVRDGERLLDVLVRRGVTVPHVCYQENLGPIETCDTCFVEISPPAGAEGTDRKELVRACSYVVNADLVCSTVSEDAEMARREGMQRILSKHELYCTVCENNNGTCVVHNTFSEMDIDHPSYAFQPKGYAVDDSHPFYRYDPDQCILCGRCVEACQNFQVNETLSIDWSSERPRVLWDGGVEAGSSSCVGCGHCVTVCPCNALMEKGMIAKAGLLTSIPRKVRDPLVSLTKAVEPATGLKAILSLSEAESAARHAQISRTKTVCTYCGVGCSFEMWTTQRSILKVEPTTEGPANAISTCVKGKFGWEYVNSPDRLTSPLIRRGDHFEEASWEEALTFIGSSLAEIRAQSGPDAIGLISSSKCTNEESYLMQKLARAVIGTHNIDNCSRYCQSPATMGLWRTVGYGGDSGSITDIAGAGLVLIVGSNTAESHPVVAARIKRAHKLHGQRLIVADLRRNDMAERADIYLHPRPGTDLVWLGAVTKYIIDNGLADRDFIATKTNDFEEYCASIDGLTLEYAAQVSGVAVETLKAVAHEIVAADGVCALWAMGVTQHQRGSDTSTALANLLLATGNFARPHAGAYPLRGHNNVQGASDFGSMPTFFPGYQSVDDRSVVQRFEAAWGVTLPSTKGLDNHEMVDAIQRGEMKALYLIGEDMGLVDSNALHVQDALTKLDFFIVQDLFFSTTASFANVVLPASPSVEKEGTFTNTERRIQRLYEVFEPLGDSRPDWRIIQGVAQSLGAAWDYHHPSEIMEEAAQVTPLFAGVTYDRLEGFSSLQWPVSEDGSGTANLYFDGFTFDDGRAKFFPLEFHEPSEVPDEEFDLHLNNGRLLEHFHEGNMTYRTKGLADHTPEPFVEVSPELAKERGVQSGSLVRLVSRRGAVKVKALVTDRVSGYELYMPMNARSNLSAVNVLTSSLTDVATHTPAYKELAVKMEVLLTTGRSPLPRRNFRFGVRTPQRGVLVEEKWKRSDYVKPPLRQHGGRS
jgi:formate dehydrogenase major subunit